MLSHTHNAKRLLLGLGIICLLGLFSFLLKEIFLADTTVRSFILQLEGSSWEHSWQKVVVGGISRYGDWPELMLLGGIGFFAARFFCNEKWQRIFLVAMLASTLAGGLVNSLRLTTGRTRPRVSPAMEQGWYGPYHEGKWLIGKSEFNSFPSGHTATAIGFAAVIFFGSPGWGCLSLLVAFAIAGSRLLLGAHHPSDLLAATLVALAVAWFCWRHRYFLTERFIAKANRLKAKGQRRYI